MRYSGIFILMFVCLIIHAWNCEGQNTVKPHHFALKTDISSVLNPDYPAITFGGEYFTRNDNSIEIAIGYGGFQPYGIHSDTQFVAPFVLKVNGEFKVYINNNLGLQNAQPYNPLFPQDPFKADSRRSYLSLEEFYQVAEFNASATATDSLYKIQAGRVDNFVVMKEVFGFNLKLGEEWILPGGHFMLDGWVGLGLKYRQIDNSELDISGDRTYKYNTMTNLAQRLHDLRESYLFGPGSGLRINLPVGIKIGYLL